MADDETYEQELQIGNLFRAIASGFKRLEKLADAAKIQGEVRDLTSKLQEAKTCAHRPHHLMYSTVWPPLFCINFADSSSPFRM